MTTGYMTIDDDSSIYVGGIPYDCTDEVLRHTFEIYGSVVDIKVTDPLIRCTLQDSH